MQQVCGQCGRPINANAKFCSACGARLGAVTPGRQRLQPGQEIQGQVRILRALGKGGMGLVYLAQNRQAFDRLCVVKEMLDYFDPNDPQQAATASQRFEDEARTLSRLNHPGIPGIVAYFSAAGHNYIVMDYVEGQNLEDLLSRPLPTGQVLRYGVEVCQILEYLAGLNPPLVHHDIKPANIIVDASANRARLVDFGTAKARLALQPGGGVGIQKSSIYGTVGYAPPEQYKGQSEPRSDVYALAATLYHVITTDDPGGHPLLFPQLRTLTSTVRDALSRALEQDVTRRATALEFRLALETAYNAATRAASSPRKATTRASTPLQPLAAHESYALVSRQLPAPSLRPQLTRLLETQQGISAIDAEVLTWQAPTAYLRQADNAQTQAFFAQVTNLGVATHLIRTSQLLSWRAGLSAAECRRLRDKGEFSINQLKFPADRVCYCHACGHHWTTQAQDASRLRPTCSKCGHHWYVHRIFCCHICGHEFAHADQAQSPAKLFPYCPACNAQGWLPSQQPQLVKGTLKLVERVPAGATVYTQFKLTTTHNAVVQGRAVFNVPWLTVKDLLATGAIDLTINAATLQQRQTYRADGWAITNAGSTQLSVEIEVQAPPRLEVSPTSLDFGVVKANEIASLTIAIRNGGDLPLSGRIVATPSWLRISQTTFQNKDSIQCEVDGADLYVPGLNATSIAVESNAGTQVIPVIATALSTTLEVTPPALDLGYHLRRGDAQATIHLANIGLGYLEGEVRTSAPWLKVDQATFADNNAAIKVSAALDGLVRGVSYAETVTIQSNGGEVELPVQLRISPHGAFQHVLRHNAWVQLLLLLLTLGGGFWAWQQIGLAQSGRPIVVRPPVTVQATPAQAGGSARSTSLATSSATSSATSTIGARKANGTPQATTGTVAATTQPKGQGTASAANASPATKASPRPATPAARLATPPAAAADAARLGAEPASPAYVAACPDRQVQITYPATGATLSGRVAVVGTATADSAGYYKLEYAPENRDWFSYLAGSRAYVTNGTLATIDSSTLDNGGYRLRLTVISSSGVDPQPCTIPVQVRN